MKAIFCLFLFLTPLFGQDKVATTEDGKEVILHDDGTWSSIKVDFKQANANVARVGQVGVEPPIFLKRSSPKYPERALAKRIQGYVILEAIFHKNGTVDNIKVLRELGKGKYGFEPSAVSCIQEWEYLPGKVSGKPADVRMTLKVDFTL